VRRAGPTATAAYNRHRLQPSHRVRTRPDGADGAGRLVARALL